MPDIDLRFHKDMLVLSTPVSSAFERLGIDVVHDFELTVLLEPDTLEDAYRFESIAGAQCLVAATASLTPARLAHARMEDRANDLVKAAIEAVRAFKPQHILVEVGPCGLPLDGSSKDSLLENRDQYARAGRLFSEVEFDAFFLNGFKTTTDLKCALMGLRKVSDAPILASVDVSADGTLASGRGTLEEAFGVMAEFGASVAGFATSAAQDDSVALARRAAGAVTLPLMVQLEVAKRDARAQGPTAENPYYAPDAMVAAAEALRAAGVQFLRATGDATPAYTGALAATVMGLDAQGRSHADCAGVGLRAGEAGSHANGAEDGGASPELDDELAAFVARARERVSAALSGNLEIIEKDGPSVE